jgi:hypothetical protein
MPESTINPDPTSETEPTIDNILPKWKHRYKTSPFDISETIDTYREKGVIVCIPGGFSCPWCDSPCVEIGRTYVAVCIRNPLHKVLWTLWGG